MTQKEKILARLKRGPATSPELNEIAFRYSARIDDLRKLGHNITSERLKQGVWLFTLIEPPVPEPVAPPADPEVREQATLLEVPQIKPRQDWG